MKKYLPLLLATVAASAFAETVEPANTFGVLRVDSALAKTIVAVPWVQLNATGTDSALTVADYVKTENLTEGDKLYVYDATSAKYKMWVLDSGVWTPATTAGDDSTYVTAGAAGQQSLPLTSALWLERQNPTSNGQPVPFYLYGQVPLAAGTRPFTAGTAAEPVWNLVANSSTAPISLSAITGGGAADEIYLVNDDAAPVKFYKKNGEWGSDQYVESTTRPGRYTLKFVAATAENSAIPAGTGFWYVSTSTAPVIP